MKRHISLLILGTILTIIVSLIALPTPVAASTTIPGGDVSGTWAAAGLLAVGLILDAAIVHGQDFMTEPADTGYAYPGKLFASHGWIAPSLTVIAIAPSYGQSRPAGQDLHLPDVNPEG